MTEGDVLSVMREAYLLILKLAGPLLIVSNVIGLVVAIFQAATQIHEQTLTFVPKIIVIVIMLLGLGSWMIAQLRDFIDSLFVMMAQL